MEGPNPALVSQVAQAIYNKGVFTSKDDVLQYVEKYIREMVPKLLLESMLDAKNTDWNGQGHTYASLVTESLMGSRMTDGALSSYLLTKWFSDHGPGKEMIQKIVLGDLGTYMRKGEHASGTESPRLPAPLLKRKSQADLPDDYEKLDSILERNPFLYSYLEKLPDFAKYISSGKFIAGTKKSDCWIWIIKSVIDYKNANFLGPTLEEILTGTISERNTLAASMIGSSRMMADSYANSVTATDTYVGTGLRSCPDAFQHAKIIIKIEGELPGPVSVRVADEVRMEYPLVTAVKDTFMIFTPCDFKVEGEIFLRADKKIEIVQTRIV